MIEELKTNLVPMIDGVPLYVYEGLLSVFCIGTALLLAFKGKKAWRGVARLLLVEYVFLIYCSTVLFRAAKELREYDFTPFWSYSRPDLLIENIMNVVVFVPVGLLPGLIILKARKGWRTQISRISLIVGAGLIISGSIEILQYFLKRGFSEVDDIMHNTLGCLIGFMIVAIIEGIWLLHKRYSMN